MGKRHRLINDAIVVAIGRDEDSDLNFLQKCIYFWRLFHISLLRCRPETLQKLQANLWRVDPAEYRKSFGGAGKRGKSRPQPVGGLGYSGSTFFITADSKYLVKSLPRRFEHEFFQRDLLQPYYEHMASHPFSLLVRITDFLVPEYRTLGSVTNLVPAHHLVMENILYDKDANGALSQNKKKKKETSQWEKYDLKPPGYMYPQRDLVPRKLTSEKKIRKIINVFDDKVRITSDQAALLKRMLQADTAFLEKADVVDYSLFLIRFPASPASSQTVPDVPAGDQSSANSSPTSARKNWWIGPGTDWRRGVTSADGKWTYRAVLLDFMWSKRTARAKATTGAVRTFNVFARHEEMSITTPAQEYRASFLDMVDRIVEECPSNG